MFHCLKFLLFVVLELRGSKVSSLDILKDIILRTICFLLLIFFRIANNCQSVPTTPTAPTPPSPTPPTTPTTPTTPTPPTANCPAVTGQCGPATTCASLGFPGLCCSQYGVSTF